MAKGDTFFLRTTITSNGTMGLVDMSNFNVQGLGFLLQSSYVGVNAYLGNVSATDEDGNDYPQTPE